MKTCLVYMTAANAAQAARIGRSLVEERLAACVNILGPIRSVYRWKGAIQDDREVAFIAKTRATKVKALVRRVKTLHSYECPCVVAMPIESGYGPFLEWIVGETRGGME